MSGGWSDMGWFLGVPDNSTSGVRDSTSGLPAITLPASDKQLVLHNLPGTFLTDPTDVRVATFGSRLTWDFRTFEDDASSDWEEPDSVRFFVEGTTDGVSYFPISGVSDIVLIGGAIDQLKALQQPGEAFTPFGFNIPPFNGYVRFGMSVTGNLDASEYLLLDNVQIEAIPVPEPAGGVLALLALAGTTFAWRRRQKG
jgi:hypothetical protein